MTKILMLDDYDCHSDGDFTPYKVYNVIKDVIFIYDENDSRTELPYSLVLDKGNYQGDRCLYVLDDLGHEIIINSERRDFNFIIVENNKELAQAIIDNVDGIEDVFVKFYEMVKELK